MRRKNVPAELTNLSLWPAVDPSALDEVARHLYLQREQAVHAYFNGERLALIERRFGVRRNSVNWLVDRCIAPHADGRIQGFRGLIPFARVKTYERSKPAQARSLHGGLAGAFGQLLEQFPNIAGIIERRIAGGDLRLSDNNRLIGLHDAQEAFLSACRQMQLGPKDYPLSQIERAYRSLAYFARSRLEARVPTRHLSANDARQTAIHPFSVVEMDGHKLDLRLRVRYTEPSGLAVDLETERLFVIVILDVCTRAVLGWQLVLASEYNRYDVLLAVQNALMPRRKRKEFLAVPGLTYASTAGFVSEVCPQAAYACWNELRFDNARAHLAEDTGTALCEFVGCRVDAGPVHQPALRPYIERFFRTLTDRFATRMPGTTGRSPDDPAGKKGKKLPVENLVLIQELEELLDVVIANYNGTQHDGLTGHTPLEAMQFLLDQKKAVARTLPGHLRNRIHQLQPVHMSTVHGNPSRGVAPYISLYGTRYSNEVLERTTGLLRTQIRVYMNPDDMREAWAYLPNGAELGRLNVISGWRYCRHTLRLRQHILQLRRRGKIAFADEQDPISIFSDFQKSKIKKSRRDATLTAQLAQMTRSDPPSEQQPAPPRRDPNAPIIPIPLPGLDVQNF
jgi:hypothetical protein